MLVRPDFSEPPRLGPFYSLRATERVRVPYLAALHSFETPVPSL